MAHGITVKDVFGEVRANGEKAWHGLGVEIPDGLGAWDGFKRIGLDWETELVPVTVKYGDKEVTDPDSMMHVRKDTCESLGIVGKDYRPISNRYLAEFADNLCGADKAVTLETAGSLLRGKRVFTTVRLPHDIQVVESDILEMYVVGSNTHDGSGAFQWYATSVRVVCANTLALSEHSARNMIRFQHSGDIKVKVEAAQASLGIISKDIKRYQEEVQALANKGMKKAQINDYMEAVYDSTFGKISAEWPEKQQATRREHKSKTVAMWMAKMDEPNQSIKGIGGTAWAAFNAFTEWADHERGRFLDVKESEARVHSNLFGISSKDKKKAWRQALQLV